MTRRGTAALAAILLLALPKVGLAQEDAPAAAGPGEAGPPDATEPVRAGSVDADAAGPSGEQLFLACAGCHALDAGNTDLVGPHLDGIVGREAAALAGYAYSEALSAASFVWDRNVLFSWIVAAETLVPGTHMLHHNHLEPDEVFRLIDFLERGARSGTVAP